MNIYALPALRGVRTKHQHMTTKGGALTLRVARKQVEALDICSFDLVDPRGTPLPPFSAGSHIDVHVNGQMTRQYSLCNDSAENHRYHIAVLRDPVSRGGSRSMHDELHVGDLVRVSAPKNHFQLANDAQRSLLLAGGIGITPILCMAERLATNGAAFSLHYCTRSRERTAFRERIERGTFAGQVEFHFDDGAETQKLDIRALLSRHRHDTHLYVCGPTGFMNAVLGTARTSGWPEMRLHYEFFGAVVAKPNGSTEFEVRLSSSGKVVIVPSDKSVVQALAEIGVEIPTSCEQGVCGTCLTRVLEGEPEHRDLFLTPQEQAKNDQFLPCCSRAKSTRLVLDL
jgi:vanillate O-demethylase ferredoxin subunit